MRFAFQCLYVSFPLFISLSHLSLNQGGFWTNVLTWHTEIFLSMKEIMIFVNLVQESSGSGLTSAVPKYSGKISLSAIILIFIFFITRQYLEECSQNLQSNNTSVTVLEMIPTALHITA